METTYAFHDLIVEVLRNAQVPLSAQEIWDKAQEFGFDKKLDSFGKTPWATINARLYTNIKEKSESSQFVQVTKRPAKFWLRSRGFESIEKIDFFESQIDKPDDAVRKQKFTERDLHPLLVKYLYSAPGFYCMTKTIFHERSTKKSKGANEWLHPDLVGVYFPFEDYRPETIALQKQLNVSSVDLFAFEMKIRLSFSNLRQSYFQAVSNTSWATEGYLVCLEYDQDRDFINELQRLSNSFGIGVIKLNTDNINESEVVFPAQVKDEIDWATVNRLAEDSPDFRSFISDLSEDIKLSKIKSTYDKVLDDEEFEAYLKEKWINPR